MNKKDEEQELGKSGVDKFLDIPADNSPKALDGGWGWMVVLGTGLCHVIFGIVMRAFGVTYMELLDRFKGSATATAWIGAINMTLVGLLAPIVSLLCERFSSRSVTITGGLLLAIGLIGTGFAPDLLTAYFTFGVIAGVGTSLAYTPGFIVIGEYFENRKGFAMSAATCASGFGSMFPPIMLHLFDTYGFSGALLIIGSISLHCCLGGALYRPLKENYKRTTNRKINSINTDKKDLCKSFHELSVLPVDCDNSEEDLTPSHTRNSIKSSVGFEKIKEEVTVMIGPQGKYQEEQMETAYKKLTAKQKILDLTLFNHVRFLSLFFAVFCIACNIGVTTAFMPVLAIARGVSPSKAVSLLTVSGVTSTVGSIVFGLFIDFKAVKPWRIYLYLFALFLIGVSTFLFPFSQSYVALVIFVCIRSTLAGYFMSQRATVASDIVGKKRENRAVSLILFATALGYLCGRAVGGIIKDTTGMYDVAFYAAGICPVSGSALMFCTEFKHSKRSSL